MNYISQDMQIDVDDQKLPVPEEVQEAIRTLLRWSGDDPQREGLIDSVTAISGSGPAYVFLFLEAMQEAARELGLSADSARTLAIQTVIGAAQLAEQSTDPVSVLRERVTSKGGTTEAALKKKAELGVKEGLMAGMYAAAERSRELGIELGRD